MALVNLLIYGDATQRAVGLRALPVGLSVALVNLSIYCDATQLAVGLRALPVGLVINWS